MSAVASKLDAPLLCTRNGLADVIRWLKNDSYVVIYAEYGLFFHDCKSDEKSEKQIEAFLSTHRIIYINVSKNQALLDEGGWSRSIKNAGFNECTCSLIERVSNSTGIPHVRYLKLNY